LAGDDNGCSQNLREQSQLISEAEASEYWIRRVEFLGNATIRSKVLARRVFLVEGDIFTRKVLERSVRSLSKLKIIKPVQLSDVEVKLVREHKVIDFLICVQEKRSR
jgi:outer membrane protein assembly factor BamA